MPEMKESKRGDDELRQNIEAWIQENPLHPVCIHGIHVVTESRKFVEPTTFHPKGKETSTNTAVDKPQHTTAAKMQIAKLLLLANYPIFALADRCSDVR